MKRHLLLLLSLLLVSLSALASPKVKVACIGNSITYGAGIMNRDKNSYPAQIQAYLGEAYDVRNFGVSARTLLTGGDLPYIQTNEYKQSLDFQPDIVLIKLGTNDSKPQNRGLLATDYRRDYQALIDSYKALPSRPRVILLSPVKCFTDDNISDSVIGGRIVPLTREIAYDNSLETLNLYNLFGNSWESHLMPDRIHPSSIGAGTLAADIAGYIAALPARTTVAGYPKALPAVTDTANFHGYTQYNFRMDATKKNSGVACHLVLPRMAAQGNPWVLRARFWGHEPQTDIALLEAGFAIAYCDVADLFGSPAAVKRWDSFYKLMTRAGFDRKVVLEGMSRGGLIVYNWAARHPERVACIYADAPVMDLGSWPMTYSPGPDTERMLAAYGFRDQAQARAWRGNPVDHAALIARAGIPVLHVVGDADQVVPVAENTAIFEERYQAAGGSRMEVIHKPGVGHHPHSLNDPAPIVCFILKATGRWENPCVRPVPGNEYRSAAGWAGGNEWHAVAEDITATLHRQAAQLGANGRLKLLLLGNSITQGFGGCRTAVTHKPGREAMDAVIGDSLRWVSAGISGDRTQHLLWRIQNGDYNCARPENVVITIGINNVLAGGDTPQDIAAGIEAVAGEASRVFPDSRIILLGLLPAGLEPASDVRLKCDAIHAILAAHREQLPDNVEYINPTPWFTLQDGKLDSLLYSGDYIHLTSAGYAQWSGRLKEMMH